MTEVAVTKLRFLQGYRFRAEFDVESIPNLLVDEITPIGESFGPNPARLLAVAVGHCLSSSLLFCLSKARVEIRSLETTVKTSIDRNKEGRLRIKKIDVHIDLDVEEEDKTRVSRCLKIFEDYCTVTQSVRKGISINVNKL